ncbi:CoA pyrophosphatase [uncultured Shewanella sp.]|uniref:CoA pyrophosphatase n=1 Tax=Shewanella atlantica TaxID=271099 RepID=UPI002632F1A1|nr:CoA pyrophosphatase [uncultured Shewanella sp.]
MNLVELRIRFNLQPLSVHTSPTVSSVLQQAAVLIAFTQIEGDTHLILTRRPGHLRHHPGQISFPGGKVEADDITPIATALREAEEEIALTRNNVEVLGQHPRYKTFTGFEITPVFGIVKQSFKPVLDPGEVADYFTVPLSFLLNTGNRKQYLYRRHGVEYPVYFIPYKQHVIWGATAAIIEHLCKQLS